MADDLLLDMQGVRKSFAGTPALVDGRLQVGRGEVHALIGQNGAGKSTLLKVLTGVYNRDAGTIRFDGVDASFRSPHEAQQAGISPIYQEINLVPQRSVAQNIFLGREPRRRGFIDRRRMEAETVRLLKGIGIEIDPGVPLGTLSTATQQMVAIARALSFDSKLLIMDEPTSSLHDREVETLFGVIRQLKTDGVSVIFVSHKLEELYAVCDGITVLRDGATVAQEELATMSKLQLVAVMLGRDPGTIRADGATAFERPSQSTAGGEVLRAESLGSWPALRGATLEIRAGEIVGLAGLLGSGRTELARAVFGAGPVDSGSLTALGTGDAPKSPGEAIRRGVAMTPEDRKVEGIIPGMSVRDNLTLSLLPKLTRFGFISRRRQNAVVDRYMQRLGIKASSPNQAISELSGGNQQKVLLARSLALDPRLLILDEPTRGVDVGAKAEIQELISESVDAERGVLLISSEMEEISEGSDRVYVLRDGRTVAHYGHQEASQDALMQAMASGEALDAHSVTTEKAK